MSGYTDQNKIKWSNQSFFFINLLIIVILYTQIPVLHKTICSTTNTLNEYYIGRVEISICIINDAVE